MLRSRTEEQAEIEFRDLEETVAAEKARTDSAGVKIKESLLRRKYVIPFVLACVILACNQATGVNSIIGYNATILMQAGLRDSNAHLGYVILTLVNFLVTMVSVALVDKKGRKFLLSIGSAGIIVSLICTGLMFQKTEKLRVDVRTAVQAMVSSDQTATIDFNQQTASALLGGKDVPEISTLVVIYSYGDFNAASKVVRSDDSAGKIEIARDSCVPANKVAAFFQNPFADLEKARTAPLKIENALLTPLPSVRNGWITALCIFSFMAFFAIGPGVCVWLALSELMPTRIRSNGMSVALLVNQAVSTGIAGTFLPIVGKHGYATMFFIFAGCTVVYFLTVVFFLPETKGKTLEEIEENFAGRKSRA